MPEPVNDSRCDHKRDREYEQTVWSKEETVLSGLPTCQPESDHAEDEAARQAADRVRQSWMKPDAGNQCGQHKHWDGDRKADQIDGDEPAPRALTRDAPAISLHECDRDERHDREDHEHRNEQNRHTIQLRRPGANSQLVSVPPSITLEAIS